MKQVTSAGIVVYRRINNDIEYLLLHYAAGHWDFPKGKMEPGETLEETATRELQEEAGIQATILADFQESFSYSFQDYDGERAFKTVYYFVGEAKSHAVTLSHEHKDFMWFPYKDACAQLTYANARALLKQVDDFLHELNVKKVLE